MDTATTGGMGVGTWAIAIIILIGLFNRNGGGLFGGDSGYCGNGVGTRDILDTQFALATANSNKIEALAAQSASQFYNLSNGQKDLEIARLRDENYKLFAQSETAKVLSGQDRISCQIAQLPKAAPFYACGGYPELTSICK